MMPRIILPAILSFILSPAFAENLTGTWFKYKARCSEEFSRGTVVYEGFLTQEILSQELLNNKVKFRNSFALKAVGVYGVPDIVKVDNKESSALKIKPWSPEEFKSACDEVSGELSTIDVKSKSTQACFLMRGNTSIWFGIRPLQDGADLFGMIKVTNLKLRDMSCDFEMDSYRLVIEGP